jgi:hypothetical protein
MRFDQTPNIEAIVSQIAATKAKATGAKGELVISK